MTDILERAAAALEGVPPGPWDWEVNRSSRVVELCGGRGATDLTIMSFRRYGVQGAAPVFWSWKGNYAEEVKRADELAVPSPGRDHHAKWFARINHPVARFIAAARQLVPDMAAEITALRARAEAAEARNTVALAILAIMDGDEGFVVGTPWGDGSEASKHDRCIHENWRYEGCADCLDAALRKALEAPKEGE